MHGGKRRLALLAMLMVLLVGAVSIFSTRYLYETSLAEQKKRLHELVQSQASLTTELGWMSLQLEMAGGAEVSRDVILDHLSKAHQKFQIESDSGEFTVGARRGDAIKFFIVNGYKVEPGDPIENIKLNSPYAKPMEQALLGESGTMIGLDYRGVEVLAAYTPLYLRYEALGLVAKIDVDDIKAPFVKANIVIFVVGILLTSICIGFFFRLSEPLIRDLRLSEQNYRDLVEGANTLIVRIAIDGTISFANDYAKNFLNGGEELGGVSFSSQTDEIPDNKELQELLDFFEKREGDNHMPMLTASGKVGWVAWSIRPIFSGDDVLELLCIGNDVTSAHLASEAKKEIEERFRGIAKASPVGIVITDMQGNLLYANERMHDLTKTNAVDLVGRGWLDRIDPRDRNELLGQWFNSTGRVLGRMEFRLVPTYGDKLWALGQIVEMKNAQSEIVGAVLTFTDITKIKETERAHSRLSAAIEQAAEMVILTDLTGKITYVNPAFQVITGYSREEAIGQNPRILNSGEQDEEFYNELWGTVTAGGIWYGRFINIRKDGRRYTQESSIGPVRDTQNQIIGYVGVARDISDQISVEAQLRQAQKLESIGELAAGIAHEINTPAQYVSSNLQFLEESFQTYFKQVEKSQELVKYICDSKGEIIPEELEEKARESVDDSEMEFLAEDIPNALAESEAGLKRISEIVQSVKQLAHPGEVRKSFHDLNDIVRDAVTVSSNEWKYVADIEFALEADLPSINCLRGEVGQVVLNLIVNGAHAIEAKKASSSERGVIRLHTYAEDGMAVLEVTDTGTGIPEELVSKVFDPFFTTKEVGKGTGQGLAITYNVITNMHDGNVDVRTEEGKGSTFIIRLPISEG